MKTICQPSAKYYSEFDSVIISVIWFRTPFGNSHCHKNNHQSSLGITNTSSKSNNLDQPVDIMQPYDKNQGHCLFIIDHGAVRIMNPFCKWRVHYLNDFSTVCISLHIIDIWIFCWCKMLFRLVNTNIHIHFMTENAFHCVFCEISSILSRPQLVNMWILDDSAIIFCQYTYHVVVNYYRDENDY